MSITNNVPMSGYKSIKNTKNYTNERLCRELLELNIEFSAGTPSIGELKDKEVIRFSEDFGGMIVYIKVTEKKIEIARIADSMSSSKIAEDIAIGLLTEAPSKKGVSAERSVDEIYDIVVQILNGQEVNASKINDVKKTLYMKEKILAIKGKYNIYNLHEEPVYYIESNLLGLTYKVQDGSGNIVMEIKKKMVSVMPEYALIQNGKKLGSIRKRIKLVNTEISGECNGQNLSIKGNLLSHNFSIFLEDNLIGNVDTERLKWGDVYSIDIVDISKEALVVTVAVICDKIADAAESH